MKNAFGRLAIFAVASVALAFVCEGEGKADMEWQPVVVASGGKELAVPVGAKGEKRTIPCAVPSVSCASGAQCSPARRQNPAAASLAAVSSGVSRASVNDTTGVYSAPAER